MDDQRVGAIVRATRIRRGSRQSDLAAQAATSRGTVSRVERGFLDEIALGTIRRVCRALDIRLELLARSRFGDSERTLNARHAALGERVISWLRELPGWVVRPEVSFAFYSDRGIVDVVGWHQGRRAILIVELKTEIVDVGELLGTLDRKRRVARQVGQLLGWDVDVVGVCLLVADGMTNRRRVEAHEATLRAALPADGRTLRGWLAEPAAELRAMRFVSDARQPSVRSTFAAPRRVSTRAASQKRVRPPGLRAQRDEPAA